MDASLSVRP